MENVTRFYFERRLKCKKKKNVTAIISMIVAIVAASTVVARIAGHAMRVMCAYQKRDKMINCFMGLVLIAGVWLNPCAVIYMEPSKRLDDGCFVKAVTTAGHFDMPCEDIVAAFDMKRK